MVFATLSRFFVNSIVAVLLCFLIPIDHVYGDVVFYGPFSPYPFRPPLPMRPPQAEVLPSDPPLLPLPKPPFRPQQGNRYSFWLSRDSYLEPNLIEPPYGVIQSFRRGRSCVNKICIDKDSP